LKRYIEFIVITILLVVTRFLDVFFTYRFIPDLHSEANPLVSISKFGWAGLIIAQVIIVLLIIYLAWKSFTPVSNFVTYTPGLSFNQFAWQLYHGKTNGHKKWNALTSFPKGFKRSMYVLGWLLPRVVIFAGLVTIVMHLLLMYSPAYKQMHGRLIPFIYGLMMLSIFVFNYYFARTMYNGCIKKG